MPSEETTKWAVVTGGSSGIGLQTSKALAERGFSVIFTGRSSDMNDVADAIRAAAAPGVQVAPLRLDLTSLADVKAGAEEVLRTVPEGTLRALVLNAGLQSRTLSWTTEGVETTWGCNHLGHFYLSQLLLPALLAAPAARIVITSSGTHDPRQRAPLPEPKFSHPSDMAMLRPPPDQHPKPPQAALNGALAYTRSKLCNIYHAYGLAERLTAQGVSGGKLSVVAYDPGFIPTTGLGRELPQWLKRILFPLIPWIMWLSGSPQRPSTVDWSGTYQARLAVDPEFHGVTGTYYSIREQTESSLDSYDKAKQTAVWEYSEELLARLAPTAAAMAPGTGTAAATAATTAM